MKEYLPSWLVWNNRDSTVYLHSSKGIIICIFRYRHCLTLHLFSPLNLHPNYSALIFTITRRLSLMSMRLKHISLQARSRRAHRIALLKAAAWKRRLARMEVHRLEGPAADLRLAPTSQTILPCHLPPWVWPIDSNRIACSIQHLRATWDRIFTSSISSHLVALIRVWTCWLWHSSLGS